MAVLSTADRKQLPASTFAGPGRSFPIPDKVHAQKAAITSTPLACSLTAAIPAIISLVNSIHISGPHFFEMELDGFIETTLFFACVAWFLNELRHQRGEVRSREYLDWLVTGGPPPQPKKHTWWKIWADVMSAAKKR